MSEQTAKPIPTQLNIAPRGKTWKNWELVDGTDGFPTRESMEKYLCNPERVRELEECRDRNLATIKQLNNLLQCSGCAVQQGYVPVETLSAEIKEPVDAVRAEFESFSKFSKCEWSLDWDTAGFYTDIKADSAFLWFQHGYQRAQLAAVQQVVQPEPWCPDVCPITGRKFFMWIEHWETGKDVPTYGGPYDSYTIPVKDSDGTFSCERYDHDAGEWMTEGIGWECVGLMLVDDQSFVAEPNNQRYMEIEHFATHPTQQGLDAQLYRLLDHGELIEAGDQFLWDDFTWQIDPRGIFVGTPLGCVHRPARRAIAAQAKQGGV